ncbi:translation initiation factor IF-2-like [Coturnix japonica]|uniref:translation initiation factor IF-2-like n=1 Tax=Coturnix japonica TaxID=93934 RepID=UPI0007771F30|nr:translation initiation factor IF-2-like [Coturnix japonica]
MRDAGMAALGGRAGRRPGRVPAENGARWERMLGGSTNGGALPRGLRSGEEGGESPPSGARDAGRTHGAGAPRSPPGRKRRSGPAAAAHLGHGPSRPEPRGRSGGSAEPRTWGAVPGEGPSATERGRHRDFPPRRARATPPNSARSGRRPTATDRTAPRAPRPAPLGPGTPRQRQVPPVPVSVSVPEPPRGVGQRHAAPSRGTRNGAAPAPPLSPRAAPARRPSGTPPPPRTAPPQAGTPPHRPPSRDRFSMETPVRGPLGAVRSPPSARPRRWVRSDRARGYPRTAERGARRGEAGPCPERAADRTAARRAAVRRRRRHWQRQPECEGESEPPPPRGMTGAVVRPPRPAARRAAPRTAAPGVPRARPARDGGGGAVRSRPSPERGNGRREGASREEGERARHGTRGEEGAGGGTEIGGG